MKKTLAVLVSALCFMVAGFQYAEATDVPLSFTLLSGYTGGFPAQTAVYYADLTGLSLTSLQSITILDDSSGLGGSPGQFSGFDLDAIKLSYTLAGNASSVNGLSGLNVLDFSTSGTVFTPGYQTSPLDPKLFGTGVSGNTIDNDVATLGLFDGNSTTAIPGADGFVSMGYDGKVSFNLTSAITDFTGLYLYIGEVGDNGEVAAGVISVSDTPVPTPEPCALLLLGFGIVGVAGVKRFRR